MAFDHSILEDIEANLHALDINEIKERLAPLITGIRIETPVFNPGAFLYRVRKMGTQFNKQVAIKLEDLIYPPTHRATLGRLNRSEQSIFYCSTYKDSAFFEIQELQKGDEVVLTFWKTRETMLVNNVGYTECVFRNLGASRPVPQWTPPVIELGTNKSTIGLSDISPEIIENLMSEDAIRDSREAFSRYFMSQVGPTEKDSYKITTAIGELHLGKVTNRQTQFAGILYPSVRTWANGDNLALLPWFVDQHVEFRKALHVRIDDRADPTMSITALDLAKEFDANGNLIWLGRIPSRTLQPGRKATLTLVPDRDEDGDYVTSAEGQPCHWTVVDADTGEPIAAH